MHTLLGVQLQLGPVPLLPRANAAEDSPSTRQIGSGVLSASVPSAWVEDRSSGVWNDPVLGVVADKITISEVATSFASVDELGKLAEIPMSAFGFEDLARADLVSGQKRTSNGAIFFDYDLALSPAVCAREDEIVPGACLPTKVVLISAGVSDGRMCTLRVDANPAEWKRASGQLRTLRSSFGHA
eukprot:CAMPEP_0119416752 /NCGR_PEP_ID=MMETSP1335-20130426/13987_1 /TAXON_ID=259385 /ORGANISM="Chrysoculter rhomboideus, Strain RCC1486" /LENGTH=184 /DNA_ID=CAMNT_0007441893 /DNA_START=1 /DNA_END=555 /DNA_ORIENTATION=+